MKYNFTEQAHDLVDLAWEEAIRLGQDQVAPQHIVLAILRERDGVAANVLRSLPVDLGEVRVRMEQADSQGDAGVRGGRVPHTRSTARVFELAIAESRENCHSYVGVEHVLLGILRAEGGGVITILNQLGVTYDRVRRQALEHLWD